MTAIDNIHIRISQNRFRKLSFNGSNLAVMKLLTPQWCPKYCQRYINGRVNLNLHAKKKV